MTRHRHPLLLASLVPTAALTLALALGTAAGAADFSGSIQVSAGTFEVGDVRSDLLDQQYSLRLVQPLTEFLSLSISHRHSQLDAGIAGGAEGSQRLRSPALLLRYERPTLSGSVGYSENVQHFGPTDFSNEALTARIAWRPVGLPRFELSYRDQTNRTEEVALFGRESHSERFRAETSWGRRHWHASYAFTTLDLDNRVTGLRLETTAHEGRVGLNRQFFGDRLGFTLSGWGSVGDRREVIPAGAELGEPVPAAEGLFAVDLTPELGQLAPAPGLIDGDLANAAHPAAEIGEGNTFRNFGLDLGFARPVERLDIFVDRPSGAGVAWQVYRSADNLVWERVDGVTARFDAPLLRYVLSFPTVSERFVKAVNTTLNPVPGVAVTELRALVEVSGRPSSAGDSSLYRADATMSFRPHQRVSGRVSVGGSNDESSLGGLPRRDFRESHASASLAIDLPAHMQLSLGYRLNDFESRLDPVLLRTLEQTSATLRWSPLDTVDARLTWSLQDEHQEKILLRTTETLQLLVFTRLLPGLDLHSQVVSSNLDQVGIGERETFSWVERLEARPYDWWAIGLSTRYTRFRLPGASLTSRRGAGLDSTVQVTPYLFVRGSLDWSDEGFGEALRQSYDLSWHPGEKLALTLGYSEADAGTDRRSEVTSLTGSYRLNPRFQLFGELSRSAATSPGVPEQTTTTSRFGLSLFF